MTLRRIRIGSRIAAFAAIAVLVVGCGNSGSSADSSASGEQTSSNSDPYRVTLLASLSGPLAAVGTAAQQGVQASVDVVNANGGVLGRQVELTVQDNRGDAAEVATLVNSALASDTPPDLLIPGVTSPETAAALPLTSAAGDVLTGGTAAAANFGSSAQFPNYYSPTPLGSDSAEALVAHLKDKGVTSMALMVLDDESGAAVIQPFQDAAKAAGITVTGIEKVPPTSLDTTSQMERLRGGNPEAFVLSMFSPSVVGTALKDVKKIGWDVPVWGDNTVAGSNVGRLVEPAQLAGVTLVAPSYAVAGSEATTTPAFKQAQQAIIKQNGGQFAQAYPIYFNMYRILLLAKYGAEKAGSTDAAAIWKARTDLKIDEMPLFPGSTALFTDSNSNFMTYRPEDYVAVAAGPLDQNGLIVPATS